ncbi:MAG: outer membrane beta-barrel protein [Candidatus Omnitrophota bacterium]
MVVRTKLVPALIILLAAAGNVNASEAKKHTVTVGPEVSYIAYKEDGVKETGIVYGLFGSYTYRGKLFSEKLENAMLRVNGRLGFGQVDYDGELSDGTPYTIDNINDTLFEIRAVAGYDFPIFSTSTITPYFGVGYRYLNDDLSTDPAGYERESNYLYSPIGIETNTPFANDWSIGLTVEYDIFWLGKQRSHLSDAIPGLGDVTNDQEKGYGLKGSIKVRKETEKISFFVEPFINYWNIDKSKDAPLVFSGTIIGSAYEPKNNSLEYGLKLGAEF